MAYKVNRELSLRLKLSMAKEIFFFPDLKELHVCNNPHLKFIHSNALSRRDKDDPTREDWPLLKGVRIILKE